MPRSVSHAAARALAATLALTLAASPALATVHVVTVYPDGTFKPKYLTIASGDTVQWQGLRPTDSVARLSATALYAAQATHTVDPAAVCANGDPDDPAYVVPANPYRQAYAGADANELTGPARHGVSGIWALGPQGDGVGKLEIPSAEADAIHPGITVADGCATLVDPANDVVIPDDAATPEDESAVLEYLYVDDATSSGNAVATPLPNPVTDPDLVEHRLCTAMTFQCDGAGAHCERIDADPARPRPSRPAPTSKA